MAIFYVAFCLFTRPGKFAAPKDNRKSATLDDRSFWECSTNDKTSMAGRVWLEDMASSMM